MAEIRIEKFKPEYRDQLLQVWENSVLATHHFLKSDDFQTIKSIVHTIDFTALEVYCLIHDYRLLGFLGVADRKVEMLFIAPDQFGKGFGKKLMDVAMHKLLANKVDVNEQNIGAKEFYEHLGFKTYERTDQDDQGNNYPLLRMKL